MKSMSHLTAMVKLEMLEQRLLLADPTMTVVNPLADATEDTDFTIQFADLLTDAADADLDLVGYRIESVVSGTLLKGGVAVVPGATTFAVGESLVWTPDADENGDLDAFTIVAIDAIGGVSAPAVTVVVETAAVNDLPTLTTVDALAGTEDTALTITWAAMEAASNAADVDGDTIRYRVESVVSGTLTMDGVAVVPGATLLISGGSSWVWTPAANANGAIEAFTVVALDAAGASAPAVTVSVNVVAVNDIPTFTTIDTITGALGGEELDILYADFLAATNAADTEASPISFEIVEVYGGTLEKDGLALVAGGTFAVGETITYTPADDAAGTVAAFSVRAYDGTDYSTPAIDVLIGVGAQITDRESMTFTEDDNDTMTVSLIGAGSMIVFQDDIDGDGIGSIEEIQFVNTDATTKIRIKAGRGRGGDSIFEVGAITGTGFASLDAKGVTISGTGINLTGHAGLITIKDVINGADITLGGHASVNTIIRAGVIEDGCTITSDSRLDLYVTSYGTGEIIAPAIGTIQTKANRRLLDFGNFNADLTLAGSAFATKTLEQVKVAGNFNGATWAITGDAGDVAFKGTRDGSSTGWTVVVTGDVASWAIGSVPNGSLTVAGLLSELNAKDWQAGLVQAERIGDFTVSGSKNPVLAGDLGATVTLTGDVGLTFDAINVKGEIDGVWTVTGDSGALVAGSYAATWAGTFNDGLNKLQAKTIIAGTVNADNIQFIEAGTIDGATITLTDTPALSDLTINKITVKKGWITSSRILSAGDIGTVTAVGMEDSDIYAGIGAAVVGLPVLAADFVTEASIANVNISGAKTGKVYSDSFINSNIAAYTLGTAAVGNKAVYSIKVNYADSDNGGTDFGLSARQILSVLYKDGVNQLNDPNGFNVGDFQVVEVV